MGGCLLNVCHVLPADAGRWRTREHRLWGIIILGRFQ